MSRLVQRRYLLITLTVLFSGLALIGLRARWHSTNNLSPARPAAAQPGEAISFEANKGQATKAVKFISRGRDYDLFLTPKETVVTIIPEQRNGAVISMELVGANEKPEIVGLAERPEKKNYYIRKYNKQPLDISAETYERVLYQKVYPGIDIEFHGQDRRLSYDMKVAPGADASIVKIAYKGAERMEIDAQGDLILHTAAGKLRQLKPLAYQQLDGVRKALSVNYVLKSENEVAFNIEDPYEGKEPIYVSPSLSLDAIPTAVAAVPGQLTWELRAAFNDPRAGNLGVEGPAANIIGNQIYVSHGFRGGDGTFLSRYDITGNVWTHGGPGLPNGVVPRSEMAGGTALGRHYALGGRNGPTNANEEFDPATGLWTNKAPIPIAVGGMGAASFNNRIYVVGGRQGGTFGNGPFFNSAFAYDAASNTWITLAPMPVAVGDNYATVAYKGKIYVFGGATGPATVINTVQIYDIATNTWTLGTPMPTPRGAAMAGVIGDEIAVYGGFNGSTNLAVTELYNPASNTWSLGPQMPMPASEMAQGLLSDGSQVFAIGSGIFGASGSVVQVLVRPPAITTVDPNSGRAGDRVKISGIGFTNATSVAFDGKTDAFTVESDTTITAVVPKGAQTGRITVTTPTGMATSPNDFVIGTPGTLQFRAATFSDAEGAMATISVTRTDGTAGTVTVDYATSAGTATAGKDYVDTKGTLTFADGEREKSFTVQLVDDLLDELDETVNLTLSNATNGAVLGAVSTATLTITDNDDTPTITVEDASVPEGNSGTATLIFMVRLSAASGQEVTVDFSTADGTALSTAGAIPADYLPNKGLVTFAAGSVSQTINVTVNGDTFNEPDETLTVTLANAKNATIAKGTATGTITNDDPQPTISILDAKVQEGNAGTTKLTFTVNLSAASGQKITFDYATADGTASTADMLGGNDYLGEKGTITIEPGTATTNFSIAVNGDLLNEDDETFTVTLSNPTNATLAKAQATGTIVNDDPLPSLSIDDVKMVEGDSGTTEITFTVTMNAVSGREVKVDYASADGSAKSPKDYAAVKGTLTYPVGTTTQTIKVVVNADKLNEIDETFNVNLTNPVNAQLGKAQGTATIANDDPMPTLSIADVKLSEGDTGTTNFTFTVSLSAASGQTVTVDYTTADGNARAGKDYTATKGMLTFLEETVTQTIVVPVRAETLNELDETFTVTLSNASKATLEKGQATGTIVNDDPVPTLSVNDVRIVEGDSGTVNAVFTVALSAASGQTITVDYATGGGNAKVGKDYMPASGTLTFPEETPSMTISVAVNGDTLNELDETFGLTLANPTNATLLKAQAVGTIANDDPVPTLSISDVTVTEGDAGTVNAVFNVTLSAASGRDITVDFATGGGNAKVGKDYMSNSGTLTFPEETTSQTVTVVVNADKLNEVDETFMVTLANPVNATLAKPQGVGTITNDDPVPTLSISDVTVTEGDSGTINAVFNVTLSAPSGRDITVNYATADGSAKFNTNKTKDYVANSGTLTFPEETTSQTVTVVVNNDLLNEIDETFTVVLDKAVNATLAKGTGTGTITNNDPLPKLAINDVRVTEGNSGTVNAVFTVALSTPSGREVAVDFASADATARVNTTKTKDYVANSGKLTFPEEEPSMTITVTVNADLLNEIDETFNVNLTNPVNATIGDGQGVGTIGNDDAVPTITINDVEDNEGNFGTKDYVYTLKLSAPSGREVRVDYATANGTAGTIEPDYTAIKGTAIFPEEETAQTLTVVVKGDTLNELDETFFLNLTNPINVNIAKNQGKGLIKNEDPPVVLGFSQGNYSVSEGGTVTITVVRSSNSTGAVTVNYLTNNGSATAGSDFNDASGSLSFADGDSSPKTFTISTRDDELAEGEETVNIMLTSAQGASLGLSQATLSINDNDAAQPGQLQFSQASYSVNESGGSATITVTRTGGSNVPVAVRYSTADGSAQSGADYAEASGTLNFGVGVTSQTFTVRLIDNNLIEENETVNISLSDPTNGAKLGTSRAVLTIEDNDTAQPGQLQFSEPAYSINENGGIIVVTVTRTGGNNVPVTVGYATSDGTARAGSDYSNNAGSLSFGIGSTSESFTILVNDDNDVEGDETINLTLSAATGGATLGTSTATLTVLDNDVPADSPVLQVDTNVNFGTVNVGQLLSRNITIRNSGKGPLTYQTPELMTGAQVGFAIVAPPSQLTLAPGQSTTFGVGFRPTLVALGELEFNGSIRISSNGGNALIRLVGISVDTIEPTVKLNSPAGGETIESGTQFTIKFEGNDNDRLNGYVVAYSTDNGASFPFEIGRVVSTANELVWNVPEALETTQGRIRVMTSDRAGNRAMAVSNRFSVKRPAVPDPTPKSFIKVTLTFDPPPVGMIAPPQNVRASATEVKPGTPTSVIRPRVDDVPELLGYNVYRVPAPAPGEPMPTPEQIVGDPKNLVGSVGKDANSFDETVSSQGGGGNFVYSITSFFGGGMQSGGSNPAGTELPVIKNLTFKKGTIFMDAAGSFIKQGAVLVINETEAFPLMVDSSGAFLTVDKKERSIPSKATIKKLIKKGATVRLVVKNPDGKLSVAVTFTRDK